jgi:hypothetical integral membrane protein (TIGR02206 family)
LTKHIPIEVFTSVWWIGLLSSVFTIIVILVALKGKSNQVKSYSSYLFALLFSLLYVITNVISIKNNTWNLLQNLPFQICYVSLIIGIIVLINKKQWMFEWMIFIASLAGLYAIITPVLTIGNSPWFYFEFYFLHAGIVFIPLYLHIIHNMRCRFNSWWKTLLRNQISIMVLLLFNFSTGANYMFLIEKPIVNHIFLIGEWPFYVIIINLIVIGHVYLINKFIVLQ